MEKEGCCAVPASCGTTDKKEGSCCGPKDCGPKKGCCGLLVKGALLGGIVAFLYLAASWMLLPWHMNAMHSFKNEKAVASTLLANAPESGVYVLPYITDSSQKPAVDKPFAFVSVLSEGFDCTANAAPQMIKQFVLCVLLAGLLTCLLKKQGSGCPVAFSMKIGLLAALVHNGPSYLWWHFPLDFTLMGMVDDFVTFTLAGAVIAKFVLKKDIGCCPAKTGCA